MVEMTDSQATSAWYVHDTGGATIPALTDLLAGWGIAW